MTISLINYKSRFPDQPELVSCQWFAGKKLEKGNFPTESLVPFEAEKEK